MAKKKVRGGEENEEENHQPCCSSAKLRISMWPKVPFKAEFREWWSHCSLRPHDGKWGRMGWEQNWHEARVSLDHYQEQHEDNLLRKMINLPGLAEEGTAKIQDLLQRSCAWDWWNNWERDRKMAKAYILQPSKGSNPFNPWSLPLWYKASPWGILSFHRKGSRPASKTSPMPLKV